MKSVLGFKMAQLVTTKKLKNLRTKEVKSLNYLVETFQTKN